ncbi:MAG: M24 family metallopeptidase [Candidatus Saccharicenans sp.]|uniref:M24 family metallopeptidase n=1 Tax=Candidatus Saccharicenans sp. TaxID=2819258 RepID=UPI00404B6005
MTDRRSFLKTLGTGLVAAGAGGAVVTGSRCRPSEQPRKTALSTTGESARLLVPNPDHPVPATFDRLPLSWYQATAARLRQKAGERGLKAIVLQNTWNIIYFTGLFHTSTERPFYAVFPVEEDALYWYHPGLDRDLVTSWWSTGNEYYFDFLHSEGGYPEKGQIIVGQTVDLFEWLLTGLKKRGLGEGAIGFDTELTPSRLNKAKNVLPRATFHDISDICLKMRMVKTPEEIALTQRAMNYFSQIQAFARDYILEHGTDATDFEVAQAAREYGVELIMKDIKRDGRPHSAVGISVTISCRTGEATAYPHPNQLFHKKIERGDALQVSGGVRIGGYGGELYRYYQIAPWDAHREKLWEVVTECVLIQERESRAGRTCAEVAAAIHEYQVKMGVGKYVYHRPAHGSGQEGHQAPWLALGDNTVLEEGMMFSVEPGLYDPENGFGYNPSDNLLVARDKGIIMSSVPYTKEWMFLKL